MCTVCAVLFIRAYRRHPRLQSFWMLRSWFLRLHWFELRLLNMMSRLRTPLFAYGLQSTVWSLGLVLVVMGPSAASGPGAAQNQKGHAVTHTSFGKTPDGTETNLFSVSNARGTVMKV